LPSVSANQVKAKLDTHEAACQWKAPSDYPDDDDDKRYVCQSKSHASQLP